MSIKIQVAPNDSVAVGEIGGGGYVHSALDGYTETYRYIYQEIRNMLVQLGAAQVQLDLYDNRWEAANAACRNLN